MVRVSSNLETRLGVDGGEASTPSRQPCHVVGLDLSLTGSGIAFPSGHTQVVASKGSATASLDDRAKRIGKLVEEILDVVEGTDLVVVEAPAFSRTQGSQHDRSGLWWLVVMGLHWSKVAVAEVAPTARAKYATGKGNAGKDEVIAAVVRRFPTFTGSNNNAADALVLCAMGLDHIGQPLVDMPALHREALDKVRWPL